MPAASGHNAWFTAQSQEVAIAEKPCFVGERARTCRTAHTHPESASHGCTNAPHTLLLRFSLSTVPTGAIGPHLRHGEAALATGTPRRGESKTVHTTRRGGEKQFDHCVPLLAGGGSCTTKRSKISQQRPSDCITALLLLAAAQERKSRLAGVRPKRRD